MNRSLENILTANQILWGKYSKKILLKKLVYFISISTILTSCSIYSNFTNKAFEEIEDIQVRLIEFSEKDTVITSTYNIQYNLSGDTCLLLKTVDTLNLSKRTGITFRFWSKIISPEGYSFYGSYPTLGLLSNIESISIELINDSNSIDITKHLTGDSNLTEYIWEKYDSKYPNLGWYTSNGCFKTIPFASIDTCLHCINFEPEKLEGITKYDFIFWFNKEFQLPKNFKPSFLKVTITTYLWPPKSDKPTLLKDQVKIFTL